MAVVAAVVAMGVVGAFAYFLRRASKRSAGPQLTAGEKLLQRIEPLQVDDEGKEHLRETAAARAEAKRAADQRELTRLASPGYTLLDQLEHWKEHDERVWREEFAEFVRKFRAGSLGRLRAGTAYTIDVQCKAVRQATWPAMVTIAEVAPGQLSAQRGTLLQAMETLMTTLATAIEPMLQSEAGAAHTTHEPQRVDALVDEATDILQQISRSVVLTEHELWNLIHGWRDRMTEILTEQAGPDTADFIAKAPPLKDVPFVKLSHSTSGVPGQLQTMRQLSGWLQRLIAWRERRGAGDGAPTLR